MRFSRSWKNIGGTGLMLGITLFGCHHKAPTRTTPAPLVEERVETSPPVVTESVTTEPDGTRVTHRREVETRYYHRREIKAPPVQTGKEQRN